MSSIKNRCTQVGNAIILTEAYESFKLLASALQTDLNKSINVAESYLSKYDVINELRSLVKDKTDKPSDEIKLLLDPKKTIESIVQEGSYDKLETYIEDLADVDFEPPLPQNFVSVSNIQVALAPNKIQKDPRRTGRLVKINPPEALKAFDLQKWMLNNSVLYGFVLYADSYLYYLGVEAIKKDVAAASNKQAKLQSIISLFVKSIDTSILNVTPEQVLSSEAVPPPSSAEVQTSNLEFLPNHNLLSNSRQVLDLVIIDNLPVWRPVAASYLKMKEEAKKAGINLRLSSGFRPGFGLSEKAVTNTGRSLNITSQEVLRRQKSRWISSERAKYSSDDDYVFNAPASAFNPATAKPGSSNHGSGLAIDLNTGGRDNFQPLNSAVYSWLVKNSYKFGFIRTVKSEEWHYEYIPSAISPYDRISGTSGTNKFYNDLGLNQGAFPIV